MNDHDLLYAHPSVRMKVLERRKYADGKVTEHQRETRVHKGKLFSIDYTHKYFNVITELDFDPFPSLPIESLGLRVVPEQESSLSDFLKFPDITSFEGEDKIDGERVIVLKIGPQIPHSIRPKFWDDAAFLRVSLAPERSYLPLRMEIHPKYKPEPEKIWRRSIASLESVPDIERDGAVPFPHRLEVEDPNGARCAWVVQSAVINPKVSEEDFVMAPPPGYFVAVDGTPLMQPSRLVELVGKEAPELSVRWRGGDGKALADLRGKVVVLYFWASWCKPCVERMTGLMDLKEKLSDKPVEWIAIQDSSNQEFDEFEEQLADLQKMHWGGRRLSLQAALDESSEDSAPRGATTAKYDIQFWPTVVIIDRQGKVVGSVEKEEIEPTIRKLLE